MDDKQIEKCSECENELISEIATISIENDRLNKYVKLLEQGLDIARDLNEVLREDNVSLREKLDLLK